MYNKGDEVDGQIDKKDVYCFLPQELEYGEKPDGQDDQEDGQLLQGSRGVNLLPVRKT